MNKKNYFLFFIFLGILGVLSIFGSSVYSQDMRWESPATKFPISGNEKDIFDEGKGPGETKKRTSPLIFDGVGQAINFGAGQSISSSDKNSQIMFAPTGIVITSLNGSVLLNTKGLVLKDSGVAPSAATGSIALINGELKFNTDGTIDGWKLPVGEGIWKDENFAGGFYFKYATDDKNSMNFTLYHATQLNCDTNPNMRDCGDFVAGGQADGGYDKFTVGGVENLAVYEYRKEIKGGISYTSTNIKKEGYWYKDDIESSVLNGWLSFYEAWCAPLSCDTSDKDRECGDPVVRTSIQSCAYDLFQKDGNQYLARYTELTPGSSKVAIGSDSRAKNLIVNGSIKIGGKLSFSQKQVFKSANIKATISGAAEVTMEIIDTNSGRKDFSFCALGHQLLDNNGYYTGALCSVFYDGNKKVWILKAQRLKDGNASECGATCF